MKNTKSDWDNFSVFLILIIVCIIAGSIVNKFANPDCNDRGEEKLIDWIKCKEKRT